MASSQASPPVAEVPATPRPNDEIISFEGKVYRRVNMASVSYQLSNHSLVPVLSPLMDGGANGGMAGNDVRILSESSSNRPNVSGSGDSMIKNLSLATAAGFVSTHLGPAIVIMNQYANYGKGHTIHSSGQFRSFGTLVHEAPRSSGGLQRIITPDGYHIPLSYRSGLPYMDMRPPTDEELDPLPHMIIITSDDVWDPSSLDNEFLLEDLVLCARATFGDQDPRVNPFGHYTGNIDEDIDFLLHKFRMETEGREMPDLLEINIQH